MRKGRPKKVRIIRREPSIRLFSPRGRIGRPGYTDLKLEEYEALRLADYKCQNQADAAKDMDISQQTFSRVLKRARKCLSEALIKGYIIRIKGGDFKLRK